MMASTFDWGRVLQLGSVLISSHLAGFHYCSDAIALPNIVDLDDRNAVAKGWFRGWDVGRRIGPASVMLPAVGHALCAWSNFGTSDGVRNPTFVFNATAAAALLFITPYTLYVVFPINDALLAEHARVLKAEKAKDGPGNGAGDAAVRKHVSDWKSGDRVRMDLARIAVLAGAMAVLSAGY